MNDARFSVGQLVHHRLFEYRGVIVDVDATFDGTDEWYEQVARSRPPMDEPWYHVLPHEATHTTYVSECNLEADPTGQPISHPLLEEFFEEYRDGRYVANHSFN